MADKKSRIKRLYAGEAIGSRLADTLNEKAKPLTKGTCFIESFEGKRYQGVVGYSAASVNAGRHRVAELIDRIGELERAARTYTEQIAPTSSDPGAQLIAWRKAPKELRELVQTLNDSLEPYKFSPDVDIDFTTGRLDWDQQNSGPHDNGEVQMLSWVIKLSEQRLLDRMRICGCGRWFFAVRSDSVCCSTTCRKNEYEKRSERVEKRRANARRYYWLHKSGKVK